MVLPLIGLVALILISIILFVVGVSRYNVNASLGFIVLASVLLLTSSMFIMNEGLQLDTVESISPDTLTYNYQTVSYDVNSWNWLRVVTDVMFYGAFVGIVFGFAFNLNKRFNIKSSGNEWQV
jgi:hypothetical protein